MSDLSLLPSPSEATLLADWQQALASRVAAYEIAATTASGYRAGALKFLTWCREAGVRQVDAETFRGWKAHLLMAAYSPATVNTWLAGVKALFAWAVEAGLLEADPAKEIPGAARHGHGHKRDPLTDEEVLRLLAVPDLETPGGLRDLAILALMAYTALRTVEVHRANYENLHTRGGQLTLDVQGKGRFEADEFVSLTHPRMQAIMYDWLAERGNEPGPLFVSISNRSQGERLSLRAIRWLVKRAYGLAGVVGNKTTHSLRHTAISKAIVNGAPVQKVKSMARHRSIDTTMIYYHELDRLENPAEAFVDYGK